MRSNVRPPKRLLRASGSLALSAACPGRKVACQRRHSTPPVQCKHGGVCRRPVSGKGAAIDRSFDVPGLNRQRQPERDLATLRAPLPVRSRHVDVAEVHRRHNGHELPQARSLRAKRGRFGLGQLGLACRHARAPGGCLAPLTHLNAVIIGNEDAGADRGSCGAWRHRVDAGKGYGRAGNAAAGSLQEQTPVYPSEQRTESRAPKLRATQGVVPGKHL